LGVFGVLGVFGWGVEVTALGRPHEEINPAVNALMEASSVYPVSRVVIVMPIWQLESCVERVRKH